MNEKNVYLTFCFITLPQSHNLASAFKFFSHLSHLSLSLSLLLFLCALRRCCYCCRRVTLRQDKWGERIWNQNGRVPNIDRRDYASDLKPAYMPRVVGVFFRGHLSRSSATPAASFLISKDACLAPPVSRLSIKALMKDGPEMNFTICASQRSQTQLKPKQKFINKIVSIVELFKLDEPNLVKRSFSKTRPSPFATRNIFI